MNWGHFYLPPLSTSISSRLRKSPEDGENTIVSYYSWTCLCAKAHNQSIREYAAVAHATFLSIPLSVRLFLFVGVVHAWQEIDRRKHAAEGREGIDNFEGSLNEVLAKKWKYL